MRGKPAGRSIIRPFPVERPLQDAFPQSKTEVQLNDVIAVLQRSQVRTRELGRIDKFQAEAIAQDPAAPPRTKSGSIVSSSKR